MDEKDRLGYSTLGGDWQKIEAYPVEDYAKDLVAEINMLSEAIERLNFSADTKLQTDKKMLWKMLGSIATARGYIEVITEMKNGQKKTIKDFVQKNQ